MLSDESGSNPYLQQEVYSASPVRLRWMLIQRSAELCAMVDRLWSSGEVALGNQWLLRIREILGELLTGIIDASNPLSGPISDFYLYLLQMTLEIEKNQNRERLQVLAELLEIEAETWRLVVEKAGSEAAGNASSKPLFPALDNSLESLPGGFSLEV